MKNIFKYLAIMAMSVSLMGLVACTKEDGGKTEETPSTPANNNDRPAGDIALHAHAENGQYIHDGDTLVYTTTDADMNGSHFHEAKFFIDNQTNEDYAFNRKLQVLQGPLDLTMSECLGVCYTGLIPANRLPYTIRANENGVEYSIHTNLKQEYSGQQISYKLTIGKGQLVEDPITVYLLINVQ